MGQPGLIRPRHLLRAGAALIAALVLAAMVMAVDIWRYGGTDSGQSADAALVLGAAVLDDRPSPVLIERLRHAARLYQEGRVKAIVVTGGRDPHDSVSEAVASRDWLVASGIPEGAIILEDASRTTIENIVLARPILAAAGIGSVLVVSDPLHLRRALLIAERNGLSAAPSATPSTRYRTLATQVPFILREVWFLAQYMTLGF